MGGRFDHDRYRDWRLDVDAMSYEVCLLFPLRYLGHNMTKQYV